MPQVEGRGRLVEQQDGRALGFYPAGTEPDPVTVTIALDGATLPPPAASGGGGGSVHTPTTPVAQNLADTGVNVSMLVAISLTMVLTGTTLVLLRRRVRA